MGGTANTKTYFASSRDCGKAEKVKIHDRMTEMGDNLGMITPN
jgi:hypothetical protein